MSAASAMDHDRRMLAVPDVATATHHRTDGKIRSDRRPPRRPSVDPLGRRCFRDRGILQLRQTPLDWVGHDKARCMQFVRRLRPSKWVVADLSR